MRLSQRHIIAILLAAVAVAMPATLRAQVDAQFTQYFEVPNYYNPSAIGNNDYLRIRAGTRLQWIGIPKAPKTFLITGDMPLKLFNKRFGLGLVLQQESMGLYKNMSAGVQAGYKLKLWKGQLTIGVQLGLIDESFKGSEVVLPDDDDYHQGSDDAIPTTDIRGTAFDIAAGVFYTHRWFWAGISATHLTSPTITMSTDGSEAKNYEFKAGRVLYFMGGSNIPIKNTLFEIQPSVLVKSDFTFTQAEITGRVRYNKFLTAGVGYRLNDAISAMLSAEFKGFFLGYSYDYPLSAISKASSGSHEIFAGYSLKLDFSEKNKNKHKSIRIM